MHGQSGPPSQPEWRLPPRLSSPSQPGPPPPPRPPVASYAPAVQYSPAAPYSPANYGPISNPQRLPSPSAGADTTTWGVRFNQSSGPPLPPRPSSTNEQRYAYAQSQSYPSVATPFHGIQPSPPPPSYTTLPPPPSGVPQPPPKIPQGTQHVADQQGDQTGRAPLLAQGAGAAAMPGSYEFRPAPTLNTNTTSIGASALGPGTPSDWEHFGPTPGHFDDAAWFPPRRTPSLHHEGSQPPSRLPDDVPNVSVEDESDIVARPRTDTNQTLPSTVSGVTQSGQGGSNSPVSPCTTHGIPTPPQLVRADTTSSALSTGGRSESIDDVINAWVRPLSPAHKPVQPEHQGLPGAFYQNSPVERPQSTQNSSSFFDHLQSGSNGSAQVVEGPRRVATPVNQDPFEDLDPWAKSSLERYVAMLRKEAVADLDEERYKIFTAFMAKETKLRQILYNIEPEPESKSLTLQAPNPAPPQPLPISNKGEPAVESGLIPVASEEIPPSAATATEDEDLDDVGSEYSSGGRPLLVKKAQGGSQAVLGLPTAPSGAESSPSRPLSIISMDTQKQVLEPLTTNPPRPIYTPFQYTEGPQRGSDNLTFARPAYQGYSDLRQAAVSGRVMSNAPAPTSRSNSNTALASSAQKDPDETFLGLIRHKSVAYSKPAERNSPPVPLLPETLRQGRSRGLVEELRTIVRTPLDKRSESSWHITTREELENFPDDFSYIRRTVDQWEETARARRQKLEHERMARQDESERHIDDLFNGKEIGYADINTLEEEFRQSEARVQLEEERHEVDDFMTHVFNPLDEGLKNEISALRKSYDSALNQLDLDQQSKGSPSERGSPSVTMKIVNDLHKKLEIRFQKRLDIALDCEQRRKRAERRPLVVMGDISGLQKLDGEFDQMERRNILEACKDRDDRANRLMDSFDDAILHGLGLNQSLLDEVASKTARLDTATFRASGLPRSEIGQILKSAATFAASLGADSEAIIRSAGVADMILNDADYGVSVAEARYANSDPEIFHRLGAEKIKEDEKIQGEMGSKLQSIQEGPVQIEATIQRLLLGLHNDPQAAAPVSPVQGFSSTSPSGEVPLHPPSLRPSTTSPGPSPSPAPVSQTTDEDLEHKQRLRRALEAAKQRNAARGH